MTGDNGAAADDDDDSEVDVVALLDEVLRVDESCSEVKPEIVVEVVVVDVAAGAAGAGAVKRSPESMLGESFCFFDDLLR